MGNRSSQTIPPIPPNYKCCNHQVPTYSNTQCDRYQKYINPCCIHLNKPSKIPTCLHIKQYFAIALFNIFQLVMLLAYIISYILPTKVIIPCSLICLVCLYFVRNQKEKKNIFIFFIILGGFDLISQILVAIVPNFLVSYEVIVFSLIILLISVQFTKKQSIHSKKKQKIRTIQQAKINQQSMILQDKCCICLDQKCQYVLLPCKHASYCQDCVNKINQCSLCRVVIKEKIKINT